MMTTNIFFTSDHHFSHENILKYCPGRQAWASSVEEMNEILIQRWNEKVKPEDTVYYLGDFSLWQGAVPKYLPLLNGTKHLIVGNHDGCFKAIVKGSKKAGELRAANAYHFEYGFELVSRYQKMQLKNGKPWLLSHFPYKSDDPEERYHEWRPEDKGEFLLCGHIHDRWKTKLTPKGTPMLNVGVDVWNGYPVSLEEVIEEWKNLT